MPGVILPPDLLGAAESLVPSGRYAALQAVMRSALSLSRTQEDRRAAFVRSVEEAEAEAESEGYLKLDDVLVELDAIIAAAGTKQVSR